MDPLYDPERMLLATSHAIERARAQGRNELEPDDLLIGFLYAVSRFGIVRLGNLAIDLLALGIRFDLIEPAPGVKPRYSARTAACFDRAARLARADGLPQICPIHYLAVLGEPGVASFDALMATHGLDHAQWRSALAACPAPVGSQTNPPTSAHPQRAAASENRPPAACLATSEAPGGAPDGDAALLSPEEGARLLGLHIQTVRGYIRSGRLPAFRIAGERAIRIRRDDLVALLQAMPAARPDEASATPRS